MGRVSRSIVLSAVAAVTCLSTSVEIIPIKQKGAGPLFQIHRGAKWGYMDRRGKTVIPPEFDWEGDFFSGLAKVEKSGKWGYTNELGRLVPATMVMARKKVAQKTNSTLRWFGKCGDPEAELFWPD